MRKKIPRKEIRRILYIELEQLQIAPHSWGFVFIAHIHCRDIFCRFGQYEEISIYSFNIL